VAIGATFWVVTYFVCMVGVWASTRQSVSLADSAPTLVRTAHPVLSVPLVTAITVGMAASLIGVV
jgi:hypothetical protein